MKAMSPYKHDAGGVQKVSQETTYRTQPSKQRLGCVAKHQVNQRPQVPGRCGSCDPQQGGRGRYEGPRDITQNNIHYARAGGTEGHKPQNQPNWRQTKLSLPVRSTPNGAF